MSEFTLRQSMSEDLTLGGNKNDQQNQAHRFDNNNYRSDISQKLSNISNYQGSFRFSS